MIVVKYSCKECGAEKVEISVPTRREGEGVVAYVNEVARIVGIHHSHRNCAAKTCDLMIPISEESGVVGREK